MPVKLKNNYGMTLIELMITMAIIATITSLTTINLLNTHHQANMNASIDTLVADISQQQNKSMTGEASSGNYGLHFDSQKYVLFHGNIYNSSDSNNFPVDLGGTLEFNPLPIPNDVIFARGSGQTTQTTITIRDTTSNSTKTIYLNSYGNITQII
jgi:prepilin-type N-terminal cleavage/methylation domain-containing protein